MTRRWNLCRATQMPKLVHISFQSNLHISYKDSSSRSSTECHTSKNQALKHHHFCNRSIVLGSDVWVESKAYPYRSLLPSYSNGKLFSLPPPDVPDICKEAFNVINHITKATLNARSTAVLRSFTRTSTFKNHVGNDIDREGQQ